LLFVVELIESSAFMIFITILCSMFWKDISVIALILFLSSWRAGYCICILCCEWSRDNKGPYGHGVVIGSSAITLGRNLTVAFLTSSLDNYMRKNCRYLWYDHTIKINTSLFANTTHILYYSTNYNLIYDRDLPTWVESHPCGSVV